ATFGPARGVALQICMLAKRVWRSAIGLMAVSLLWSGGCSGSASDRAAAGSPGGHIPGGGASSPGAAVEVASGNLSDYALPGDRGTEWSFAGMLSKGGIPSGSWPLCNRTPLAPAGEGGDDSTAINQLIQGCKAGSVVQLGAGTFTM